MSMFSRTFRLLRINYILMRYNIDEVVLGSYQFAPLRLMVYFNPFYWMRNKKQSRGERIRLAIEALGPIFVKAGQLISTRRDLIPDDISIELAKLQDRVPPFCGEQAKRIVETALGCPICHVFSEFDTEALASASIAQVHAARLLSGESVVVKVLRPDIQKNIARDIDLLRTLARTASRFIRRARHMKPIALVDEVAMTLLDEVDLMHEASNASQLKRNLADCSLVYIPKIYWQHTHNNILVMERIHGIPIHEIAQLRASGVDMRQLAERCIELFFRQVFRDSFFHADMHPGNIFVSITDPKNPTFVMVDFGIVGSLNQDDQRYLAENMLAFFKRDYQRVAELHIACGWLPPDTRIDQFEGAIRSVSEPIFEQPMKDVSIGKLLLRLFQVASRFRINIQPQLILLQKTLLNIEGLSRQIAPELDMWQTAGPQIETWLKRQVGPRAFLRRVRKNLPLWSEQLPEMPTLMFEVLKEAKHEQEAKRFARSKHHTKAVRSHTKLKLAYFIAGTLISAGGLLLVNYIA